MVGKRKRPYSRRLVLNCSINIKSDVNHSRFHSIIYSNNVEKWDKEKSKNYDIFLRCVIQLNLKKDYHLKKLKQE